MPPQAQHAQRSLHGARCLVTGGAGFIGSHLTDALIERGAQVIVLDDLSNGFESNLKQSIDSGRLAFVRGSILDADLLRRVTHGCRFVFHLAALGSVPRSVKEPALYHQVNATGTMHVLEAARAAGVRRVMYAASSSAYGDQPTLPKIESMRSDPRSPYAYTKLAGEHMMRSWSLSYGMECVSLRYFNIFGPRQRPDSQYAAVIPRWAEALRRGEAPTIYGDGAQTRDFTHVSNAVHANLCAATTLAPLAGEVVNIGCGGRYSLLQLLEVMQSALGTAITPHFEPTRAGDVRDSEASITAAHALIGYEPVTMFEQGLRETLGVPVGQAS
ncbi:MAG: SDR family oxidoreductase [Planctomycetota bacterium]|nr:SDR family oxidoreductase [Planctomycetota bacterium]MDA1105905.1 SDR family oxidoreductase [Planctomycetota bacterium]